jgi:hypothetical protein
VETASGMVGTPGRRAVLIESTIRAPTGCATTSAVADWSVLLWAEVSNIQSQSVAEMRGEHRKGKIGKNGSSPARIFMG